VVGLSLALLPRWVRADSLTNRQSLLFENVPAQIAIFGSDFFVSGEYTFSVGWNSAGQFDSALGTLDSIDWLVSFHTELTTHFTYMQPPANVGPGTVTESWTVLQLRIGSPALEGKYLWLSNGLLSVGDTLSVPVGGSTNGTLPLDGTMSGHMTNPTLLSDFIQGTGFFVDTLSRYNFSAQYANGGADLPDLKVDFDVVYNFTPTDAPEPASVALLIVAGFSLYLVRRRAKALGAVSSASAVSQTAQTPHSNLAFPRA
jgi:hypothetical protein